MAKRKNPPLHTKKSEEIIGVVHPLGPGGGRGGQEALWTLRFSFEVWRRRGGEIEERPLPIFGSSAELVMTYLFPKSSRSECLSCLRLGTYPCP